MDVSYNTEILSFDLTYYRGKVESPVDLNAKSAPTNGYNYYNLPGAPTVEKKQQTSKNVKPSKKSAVKK